MGKSVFFRDHIAAGPNRNQRIAYVIDPRFPGGTSSAVARELATIDPQFKPKVYAISSAMFNGHEVSPLLAECLSSLGIDLIWDPVEIQADTVIVHNPSFLKFDTALRCRILAHQLIVVCHENFVRPSGALSFDVQSCLDQIDRASLASAKILAPISPYNRSTIESWATQSSHTAPWHILDRDWFNICDFEMTPPIGAPADRRGRLSRPGFEKFPSLADLQKCFPDTAQSNTILGGNSLLDQASKHPHWTLIPFRGMGVTEFFETIDFMVYFTSPSWRESFGRVLAEATAAGKVVLCDTKTAATFGDGIVATNPDQVDAIIRNLIENPSTYSDYVLRAQAALKVFAPDRFLDFFQDVIVTERRATQ